MGASETRPRVYFESIAFMSFYEDNAENTISDHVGDKKTLPKTTPKTD
jgi:hypothetical protein